MGIGEVAGSLSMLLVTMGLLTGASFLSLASIRGATSLITGGAASQALGAGQLIRVVATQSNSSGTYLWVFDYGWEDARLSSIFADGQTTQIRSTCNVLRQGEICAISLPAGTVGLVTLVIGERSIEVAL